MAVHEAGGPTQSAEGLTNKRPTSPSKRGSPASAAFGFWLASRAPSSSNATPSCSAPRPLSAGARLGLGDGSPVPDSGCLLRHILLALLALEEPTSGLTAGRGMLPIEACPHPEVPGPPSCLCEVALRMLEPRIQGRPSNQSREDASLSEALWP